MHRRSTALGAGLLTVALSLAFVGRSVTVIDGSLVISDTIGFLVQGRFESASPSSLAPTVEGKPAFTPPPNHSQYGLYPSLLPLPALALVWPFREIAGARIVETFAALTWAGGVAACAWMFLRLVRGLSRGASGLWAPAFVAGTFLWPYTGESFTEPWAGALLALGAERLMTADRAGSWSRGLQSALPWVAACLLKPVLWLTAPVLLLSAAWKERSEGVAKPRLSAGLLFGLAAGAAVFLATNLVRNGAPFEVGYGPVSRQFETPVLKGLLHLTLLPGRSIFLFAPLAAVSFLALPKLSAAGRLLFFLVPSAHLIAISQWWCWDGGGAWGPRHLLPVLPLLLAPAVLLPLRLTVPPLVLGAVLNLPGVLVSPGAWLAYSERLHGPPAWPALGNDRVATIPSLCPIYGHLWLLAPDRLPAPWASAGGPGPVRPNPGEFISPIWLRKAMSLPAIPPILPRVILGIARNYAVRGEREKARAFVKAAREVDPDDPVGRLLEEGLRPGR